LKNEILEQDRLNLQKKFKLVDEKKEGWMGYLKLDPVIFAYHFFTDESGQPFKCLPHQDLILNDKSQLRLLNLARGAGKSTIAAIEAIHFSYWNDNSLILIMSATKPQALEVIRKIKTFLNTSRFTTWKELFPKGKKESKAEIEIKNPGKRTYSRIISVPATDAARGYSPNIVICDELAFWEDADSIFNQVVLGMLNRVDGIKRRILSLSTPNGKHGPFWNSYNSKNWSVYDFDWRINPHNTEAKMQVLKDTMTSFQFKAEYEADFVSSQSSYFTQTEIENSVHVDAGQGYKGETGTIVSVDFGKINDACVIDIGTIINPDKPKSEQIVRLLDRRSKPLGTDYAIIIEELKAINSSIKPLKFIFDATGVGEGPSDVLKAEGLPIEAFKFTLFSKITLMNNLKILMQNKKIQIPDEKELLNQLDMFQYTASKSGGVAQPKLHAPEGYHDDEVDALALMAYGLTQGMGYFSSSFVSNIPRVKEESDVVSKGIKANNDFLDMIRKNASNQTYF